MDILEKIKLNQKNPRDITKDKFKKLKASIKEFPRMLELRPIVVKPDGEILGGNMRYLAIMELGLKIKSEWIRVADKLTPKEQERFIVEDNVSFGKWDWDVLANEFEVDDLLEWGFNEKELMLDDEGVMYSKEYKLPAYEPNDKKPGLKEVYDTTKTDKLIKEIKKANVPDNVKQFLISGAQRHTVFDYGKIADFYSNSDDETKKLFEDSALVLIDLDKAVENGFAKLTKDLMGLQENDEQETS